MQRAKGGSPRHGRLTALAALSAVVLTACGSRLGADEISFHAAAEAGAAGGDGAVDEGAPGGPPSVDQSMPGATSSGPGLTEGPVSSDAGPAPGSAPEAGQPGQAGPAGPTAPGAEAPQQGDPGTAEGPSTDTRAAPPGGNGGVTDTGVTEDRILIYNVSDLTGAVPGLFRDALDGTLAYLQYFAATEGTVYGRQIVLESRDSQLSSQGNRAAYLDACTNAFAAVGSMSAFEEGATEPIQNCSFADLRNTPTSRALQELDNSIGAFALRPGDISLAEWQYYAERFPDAIRNAGFVWLENQTTNYQVGLYLSGTKELGYSWNKQIRVALAETNYARIVNELQSADIQLVAFQGAYQQAARLAESMQQQGYTPQVFALQSNTYTPDLVTTCGRACDPFVMVAQTGSLLEEIDRTPELQLYAEWLARVNPRARPTGTGMYSWAATKLFVESLKAIGPDVTRAALLEHLGGVTGYDANGLIPPQDIAGQSAAGCVVMLDIEEGQFVRVAPAEGFLCRAGKG